MTVTATTSTDLLWPAYDSPDHLTEIERVPLQARGLPESTWAVLQRAGEQWPDRTAVTFLPSAERAAEAVDWTFRELLEAVTRTGNALRAAGAGRTTAVGLLAPNTRELLVATLAAEAVAVAAPVNPALGVDHVVELLARSAAPVLVAAGPELDPAVWQVAREVAERLGLKALLALRPVDAVGAGPALEAWPGGTVRYLQDVAAAQPGDVLLAGPPAADDVAACFHTGGTTGAPKLAAHTHRNQVVDAWAVAANSALDDDSVLFAGLPLFHVNALVVTVLAPALRGQSVVWAGPLGYREPALLARFWSLVERFRLATLSGVPTVYAALAQCPVDADISSLRFAIVGASPLPPSVAAAWEARTGVPLLEGYGLTEGTCASARGFPGHPRPGSVGQRLPYQQVKVVRQDPDTGAWEDLPLGETGVLVIAGPTVFPGYVIRWDSDGPVVDASGKVVGGWLDTGDLARVDADGFVHLVGRAKDLIIRGGHNIDPAVVEAALLAHPEVTGALAVGRPDRHAGEVPVCYVTCAPQAAVTAAELTAFAAERVPERAAAPKEVVVLEALPVTAVGKPYKVALRLDAARREAEQALADAGLAEAAGRVRAELVDGALTVLVETGRDEDVAQALSGYAFAWRRPTGAA